MFDICSGQFASTQDGTSQNLIGGISSKIQSDGTQFVSQVVISSTGKENVVSPSVKPRKLLESSEDESAATSEKIVEKKRKNRKKRKQVKKLEFSDDEDEIVSDLPLSEDSCELNQSIEQENREEDVLVDYDSEENEIEVQMVKKDRNKAVGAFFEQEAELSESDWESADEDEKDLNKYDIELGDEENYDQIQLQEEVGRIHARKMLDDDIRNVKKIEDLLFMDEENDGVGRERKFRWKNQTDSFLIEDGNAGCEDATDDGEFDEESEILWRKMRHERETMLSEQKVAESNSMSDEVLLLDHSSQEATTSSTDKLAKRKFHIIKTSSVSEFSPRSEAKINSPFLIKATNLKNLHRSSFLSRDEETLNKIARFVSHKDDEVSNISSHGMSSNTMSFMPIKKPDENKKRKSTENILQEPTKKRKVESQLKHHLLDHLK